MAMRILLPSNMAVPLIITVLVSKTRTLDGIVVALTSKAEATDGSDCIHVEADLSVGRLRLSVLGQVNGQLRWDIRRRRGRQQRSNGDPSRWRRRWLPMANGYVAASDKIFVGLIKLCPVT